MSDWTQLDSVLPLPCGLALNRWPALNRVLTSVVCLATATGSSTVCRARCAWLWARRWPDTTTRWEQIRSVWLSLESILMAELNSLCACVVAADFAGSERQRRRQRRYTLILLFFSMEAASDPVVMGWFAGAEALASALARDLRHRSTRCVLQRLNLANSGNSICSLRLTATSVARFMAS